MTTENFNIEEKMFEYANIQAEIDLLEEKKSDIKEIILKYLIENNKKNEKSMVGTFTSTSRKTWVYPEHVVNEVTALKDKIKEIEELSKSKDEAKYVESNSLTFKASTYEI